MPKQVELYWGASATVSNLDYRTKQYVLCLELVHKIVERELKTSADIILFRQIGVVASFIDEQLDNLKKEQKEMFLLDFGTLYDNLHSSKNIYTFRQTIYQFTLSSRIILEANEHNIRQLYEFITYCKSNGISDNLRQFGQNIIRLAILKHNFNSSKQIRKLLEQEGALVCGLLRDVLWNKYATNPHFEKTMAFLVECEQILNLADDCLDSLDDYRSGSINVSNSKLHRLQMFGYLTKQILKTFIYFPLQFLYFSPVLTVHYLRNK